MSERAGDRRREEREKDEQDRQDEIGYRNVDEEAPHDERGSQGPGAGDPPADEQSD